MIESTIEAKRYFDLVQILPPTDGIPRPQLAESQTQKIREQLICFIPLCLISL